MVKHLILLHGLGRTPNSLSKIQKYFTNKGFHVTNKSYNFRKYTINEIVENNITQIVNDIGINPADEVYFVTHSLGGVVLLKYLEKYPIKNLKRIILLAPPLNGSKVADIFSKFYFSTMIIGKPIKELGINNHLQYKIPGCEVGVIHGTKNAIPFFGIQETSDGLVTVQSTMHKDIKQYKSFYLTHTFMMNSNELIKSIDTFLETGSFE